MATSKTCFCFYLLLQRGRKMKMLWPVIGQYASGRENALSIFYLWALLVFVGHQRRGMKAILLFLLNGVPFSLTSIVSVFTSSIFSHSLDITSLTTPHLISTAFLSFFFLFFKKKKKEGLCNCCSLCNSKSVKTFRPVELF